MQVLEEEIGKVKANMNLTVTMESIYDQLSRMDKAIEQAQLSMKGQSNRQKAEALSGIIDKIIIHFRDNPDALPNEPSSIPTEIEVVPVAATGNPTVRYPNEMCLRSHSQTGRPLPPGDVRSACFRRRASGHSDREVSDLPGQDRMPP